MLKSQFSSTDTKFGNVIFFEELHKMLFATLKLPVVSNAEFSPIIKSPHSTKFPKSIKLVNCVMQLIVPPYSVKFPNDVKPKFVPVNFI